jgi:hypothetical protein
VKTKAMPESKGSQVVKNAATEMGNEKSVHIFDGLNGSTNSYLGLFSLRLLITCFLAFCYCLLLQQNNYVENGNSQTHHTGESILQTGISPLRSTSARASDSISITELRPDALGNDIVRLSPEIVPIRERETIEIIADVADALVAPGSERVLLAPDSFPIVRLRYATRPIQKSHKSGVIVVEGSSFSLVVYLIA